jgi:hypothetical protein
MLDTALRARKDAAVNGSEILRHWFQAHASGDLEAARGLLADNASIRVPGQRLCGFDEFMAWYQRRRTADPQFSYEVDEELIGTRHVAALLTLRSASRSWRQIAVYAVDDVQIQWIWLVEDEPEPES